MDGKKGSTKRKVYNLLRSEKFQEQFPYGAQSGDVAHLLKLSASYVSESLNYLRFAGLVDRDSQGRYKVKDSSTAALPIVTRMLEPHELARVRAGLPSAGKLTPEQEEQLAEYIKKQA
jgi:Mn-dependent DtxR family transcriptional regulator